MRVKSKYWVFWWAVAQVVCILSLIVLQRRSTFVDWALKSRFWYWRIVKHTLRVCTRVQNGAMTKTICLTLGVHAVVYMWRLEQALTEMCHVTPVCLNITECVVLRHECATRLGCIWMTPRGLWRQFEESYRSNLVFVCRMIVHLEILSDVNRV